MLEPGNNADLPPIPGKRYFTIGEVSDLCGVKPHVLRYWEQEFPQLKPVKRRGNRRYYQRQDVIIIRQIRALLYDQGFKIAGARKQLREMHKGGGDVAEKAAAIAKDQVDKTSKAVFKGYGDFTSLGQENVEAVMRELNRAKPAASKGTYMQSCSISSTMSPSVKIDNPALPAPGKWECISD